MFEKHIYSENFFQFFNKIVNSVQLPEVCAEGE